MASETARPAGLLALAAVALAVIAAVALWLAGDGPAGAAAVAPPPELTAPTASERPDARLSAQEPADAALVDAAGPSAGRIEAHAEPTAAPEAAADAACIVHGLVVGEDERPLADVAVRLAGYRGWADGFDVPRLPGKYDVRGWEMRTDASGAFRFEVPVPAVEATWLTLEPGPLLADARVDFGGPRSGAVAALGAGDHDLGAFRLAVTGAIRGTVRDDQGLPIAGAKLDVGDEPWSTYGYGAETSASGEYLVPHVPAGSYGLNAAAKGYLSRFEKPVVVERGIIAQGPDFVLAPAPTLRGRITDDAGRPIEGAHLWGWPASSGSGAGGDSAADGSFVVYLPQDEPYTLEVTAKGYEPFGVGDRSRHYAPGTDDIEIVLQPDVMTRFVVVDTRGAPVERFGLRINRNKGKRATERNSSTILEAPTPRDRPGGVVELGARPGIDRFELYAPGYLKREGEIKHDKDAPGRQTLRLSRGRSLVGRVLAQGKPVHGLEVLLTPGRLNEDVTDAGGTVQTFYEDRDERSTAATDAGGRFVFFGVEPGRQYELDASHPEKGVLRRLPVKTKGTGDTDLGDLELVPPGAISGRLLLPPGVAPAGLKIRLGDWRQDVSASTDGDARFHFDGLAPGSYVLNVDEAPGALSDGDSFGVELAAGETKEVVLDCSDRAVSGVTLIIELGGASRQGVNVTLRPVEDPHERLGLGELDADGRVSDFVRAGGEAFLEVWIPGYATLRHPTARIALAPGVQPERTIAFDLGSLLLELPAGIALPAAGSLELELGEQSYRVQFGGEGPAPRFAEVLDGGRRLRLDLLPVGTHEVGVRLVDDEAQVEMIPRDDGDFDLRKPAVYEVHAVVTVASGEVAELTLR